MSSKTKPVDPISKAGFLTGNQHKRKNVEDFQAHSLHEFDRIFREKLKEEQGENGHDFEDIENDAQLFFKVQTQHISDQTSFSRDLSRQRYLHPDLISFVKQMRKQLNVSPATPIPSILRTGSLLLNEFAGKYQLNQHYYRDPSGSIYSGKL